MFIAERQGFEPRVPRSTTVFKTAAIDHSATSPKIRFRKCFVSKAMQRYAFFLIMQAFDVKNLFFFFILLGRTHVFQQLPVETHLGFLDEVNLFRREKTLVFTYVFQI